MGFLFIFILMKFSIKYTLLIAQMALIAISADAQTKKIDSLYSLLKTEKDDTNRVKNFNKLAVWVQYRKPDSAVAFAQKAYELASKLNWVKGMAKACNNIGTACYLLGDIKKALDYFNKSLELAEKNGLEEYTMGTTGNIALSYQAEGNYTRSLEFYGKSLAMCGMYGNKNDSARIIGNIAIVYYLQGNYIKSLEANLQSLKIAAVIGDKIQESTDLGNIGLLYNDQKNYPLALDYFFKALKIDEELGDKVREATEIGNIGTSFDYEHNYDKALEYYQKALKLSEDLHDKSIESGSLVNLGILYEKHGAYSSALPLFYKALTIEEQAGDGSGQAITLNSLGRLYLKTGKYSKAKQCLDTAYNIECRIGDQHTLLEIEESISQMYDTTHQYKESLYWYKRAGDLKDTLFNIEKDKVITRKEVTFKFKQEQDSVSHEQEKKDILAEQNLKKQTVIRNSLIAGFTLTFAFAFFIFKSYRQKHKDNIIITNQKREVEEQKAIVENQKALVEGKQKEILDSINYAKRIQNALLASDKLLSQHLPEYFVLYKPKDIVSGDFYWATAKDGCFYLALGDSTGHGVPGAFMSLLNISLLNEAITEKGLNQPGLVMDHVRKKLVENMEGQQDGMDGALVKFTVRNGSATQVQYSAAYNVPVIIRNGQLNELQYDKIPVGASPNQDQPFTTYTIPIKPWSEEGGGLLYLFSDGLADQFGGPKGKKFKYKQLLELLAAITLKPLNEQKAELENQFEKWKGDMEQTDDVCLIGIRI